MKTMQEQKLKKSTEVLSEKEEKPDITCTMRRIHMEQRWWEMSVLSHNESGFKGKRNLINIKNACYFKNAELFDAQGHR